MTAVSITTLLEDEVDPTLPVVRDWWLSLTEDDDLAQREALPSQRALALGTSKKQPA